MRPFLLGTLSVLLVGCGASTPPAAVRQNASVGGKTDVDERTARTAEPVDRTNTGVNVRDRDNLAKTPIDQNENQPDINTTADIRKRVVAAGMSVEATNVKIITQDGNVTLRGPVPTADEKQTIENIANEVAGADHVDNQLEVSQN